MANKTYLKRKEKGLCIKCGKVAAREGRVECENCAKKQSILQKEDRIFFVSLGICPRCKRNKLFGSEKMCPECLTKSAEINKKSMEKLGKTPMDYYKARMEYLENAGLCRTGCGRKREVGKTYCYICLEKQRKRGKVQRARNKERKSGIERGERANYGLCYTCGKPLDREGRTCKKCAGILTMNLPNTRNVDVWKKDNQFLSYKI